MRRANSKGAGTLFLFLLAGVIVGSTIGNILGSYFDLDIFNKSIEIGTLDKPLYLDLSILRLTFGLTFIINFGTILGVLLGIYFYRKA
ncbi:MAG: DUF4321 domain-containing protein [Xylanivirga thermophila]|uniref:DUF4321 domain-containing protein n=1 Tax=Xylanivirga thermophila TaxID=2496273 RepID=UPI0013EDA919|nr:DUF4321 domain-containing protein [Xylanivirga thermophila]